jgi:conjugal transfer pilus assembly protein TraU
MILVLMALSSFAEESVGGQCVGAFANPITDICWSCMFPLSIGGAPIYTDNQEDTSNPDVFVCSCPQPVRIGIAIGFWEPARRADVTRTPYCFVSLGGVSLNPGIPAPEGEVREQADLTKQSKYQVHWYSDPILSWMQLAIDDPCLETGTFDLSYITELDPAWNDDEITDLLQPEAFLFANPIAQAACAGDCVLASSGFGSNALFWCSGCNGSVYPINGHVQAHVSHVQATSLVLHRFTVKMHREMLTWGTAGVEGLCGPYPQPVMQKDQYKYTMLYPIPETSKINGKCCQPYGRTTAIWGAGKSYPYKGEDMSYEVFRKKNCCLSVVVAP